MRASSRSKNSTPSVDRYIRSQPSAAQPVLQRVRGIIRKALPGAEETISYQIPAYKVHGKTVVFFAGWKQHWSMYPVMSAVREKFASRLEPYEFSKGTVRFPLREPVPDKLVGQIVRELARVCEERSATDGADTRLARAIGRYPSQVAATARAALKKLRAQFPGATLAVYLRPRSLPIGLVPAAGGTAPFSVVLYPRWVRFFFLEGVAIDDPDRRLEGTGNQVRSILVDPEASILDDPYIRRLMSDAVKVAGADLKSGRGQVVIKSKDGTPRTPRAPR